MSTITLPTRIHFTTKEECRLSLIRTASGHTTALFLSEEEANELALLPLIETMKAQGTLTWIKEIPTSLSQKTLSLTLKTLRSSSHDLIIAFGLGDTLNLAKLCRSGLDIPTMIAVPTSIDMMSLLSTWIAMRDVKGDLKFHQSDSMPFDHALIVSEYTMRSSRLVTLSAGLKALAMAGDAYWAKTNSKTVRLWSLQAIRRIVRNLPVVLGKPESMTEHQQLIYGSLMAAMAISNTQPGALSAISASLSDHCPINEGISAAMVLPDLLKINLGTLSNPEALYDVFNINNPDALKQWIESMAQDTVSLKLSDYGVVESDFEKLADLALSLGTMDNNPIDLTSEVITGLLKLHR
jgi:alcohol dehydrogenase class IV